MAARPAQVLFPIALVIAGTVVAGSGDSMETLENSGEGDDRSTERTGLVCPCTQGCCANAWFQYKDACYLPVTGDTHDWSTVKENCERFGTHLASVHSDDEQSFIFHVMGQRTRYWIGAEGTDDPAAPWRWTDNSTWRYEKFGQPLRPSNPPIPMALAVNRSKDKGIYWIDEPKSNQHMYVCKYLLY
ncbi:C-type lectin domain family 4 member D-like isoform X1 [Podarcis raffonei]|uniref:C-type lectin domain family 4 member D-like isoform X1 n=1 Tax=Podarcis raffonei TaxID=65483 RepID=UPI0023298DC8|nr:C-type lectin domain family 4 member D-like isoform X1 [Podarcis raffonei]